MVKPTVMTAAAIEARLHDLHCDPIADLVAIAQDTTTPAEARVGAFGLLLQAIYPARYELTGPFQGPLRLRLDDAAAAAIDRMNELRQAKAAASPQAQAAKRVMDRQREREAAARKLEAEAAIEASREREAGLEPPEPPEPPE